ncbi:hypothetical protein CNY67_05405 [Desulfovibrio sp. G11]|nr:hypothetical protein CNY67_05405 [Desulfovibrio sp. G11]
MMLLFSGSAGLRLPFAARQRLPAFFLKDCCNAAFTAGTACGSYRQKQRARFFLRQREAPGQAA